MAKNVGCAVWPFIDSSRRKSLRTTGVGERTLLASLHIDLTVIWVHCSTLHVKTFSIYLQEFFWLWASRKTIETNLLGFMYKFGKWHIEASSGFYIITYCSPFLRCIHGLCCKSKFPGSSFSQRVLEINAAQIRHRLVTLVINHKFINTM